MSVSGPRLPSQAAVDAVIDRQAYRGMRQAQVAIGSVVARESPRASGALAAALRPTLRAYGRSYVISVAATGRHGGVSMAQVIRWVMGGTRAEIRGRDRPMRLPDGRILWAVRGQHANPFMMRIATSAAPFVSERMRLGGLEAAKRLERLIA